LKDPEELAEIEIPYSVEDTDDQSIYKVPGVSIPSTFSSEEKIFDGDAEATAAARSPPTGTGDMERGEQDEALEASTSHVIHPVKTKDGVT